MDVYLCMYRQMYMYVCAYVYFLLLGVVLLNMFWIFLCFSSILYLLYVFLAILSFSVRSALIQSHYC